MIVLRNRRKRIAFNAGPFRRVAEFLRAKGAFHSHTYARNTEKSANRISRWRVKQMESDLERCRIFIPCPRKVQSKGRSCARTADQIFSSVSLCSSLSGRSGSSVSVRMNIGQEGTRNTRRTLGQASSSWTEPWCCRCRRYRKSCRSSGSDAETGTIARTQWLVAGGTQEWVECRRESSKRGFTLM